MTVAIDSTARGRASHHSSPAMSLEERYEIVKEIGDGSFGSVCLGRTRSAGAHVVRRNTMVAIKTMKKTFDNFAQCMELREVIFLKTLPHHPHLVPAYDIFLDPFSRKLHIAMEYMDGNLYQLMKSRDHKPMDGHSVKSILYQILSGLEHIHEHDFFHRDIKPENILVSTSTASDSTFPFKRYSSIMATPPSTPPSYSIKLADFGLARETNSRTPYTTYVSTRWYRAPEVLLRAGQYSAPVDMWALGAMAVEIATLKPLFPGGNEVDQVWRVCEVMGSPGLWVDKNSRPVGGGEWKDGIKLAQKLGFSFPKMAPHSIDTILQSPQWSPALARLVTWCLLWDPAARPTSTQALAHEYFDDAVDPLRPKASSTTRLLGRMQSQVLNEVSEPAQGLPTKTSSWFRRSLGHRESAASVIPEHSSPAQAPQRPGPIHANTQEVLASPKVRPPPKQRASWQQGTQTGVAPMSILPSIKPASPLQDVFNAQANSSRNIAQDKVNTKIARQLSVNSSTNHYADYHRQEAEKALTGGASDLASPTTATRESFFAHLRKRARRFSGKHGTPTSPPADDVEPVAGCGPWSNRTSMSYELPSPAEHAHAPEREDSGFAELDRVLQNVKYSLENPTAGSRASLKAPQRMPSNSSLRRENSIGGKTPGRESPSPAGPAPMANRARRSVRYATAPDNRYDIPDEEDELLDEALASAERAARRLNQTAKASLEQLPVKKTRPTLAHISSEPVPTTTPYLTPSPSKENNRFNFGRVEASTHASKPMDIKTPARPKGDLNPQWPTPPDDENDWAASAAASIFATQAAYR